MKESHILNYLKIQGSGKFFDNFWHHIDVEHLRYTVKRIVLATKSLVKISQSNSEDLLFS